MKLLANKQLWLIAREQATIHSASLECSFSHVKSPRHIDRMCACNTPRYRMNKSFQRILALALLVAGIAACTTSSKPNISGMSFADGPLTGKVVWHDLITDDLASAKRFYGGLFGWTFEETQLRNGNDYALARSGDVYVGGMVAVAAPDDGSEYSRWLPYVSVTNVDEAVARGSRRGPISQFRHVTLTSAGLPRSSILKVLSLASLLARSEIRMIALRRLHQVDLCGRSFCQTIPKVRRNSTRHLPVTTLTRLIVVAAVTRF